MVAEFAKAWGLDPAVVAATPPREHPPISVQIRAQRLAQFRDFCPVRFQEKIDRTKIPNLAAWDEADKWRGEHPGVWLWSAETGEAKTRMLWRKFGQLHVDDGKTVLRMTGQMMGESYFAAHMKGEPGDFYRLLTRYNVVMLDDLDKVDLSNERTPRMLRESFDRFYENKTPVLVTANKPIEWFAGKIGESGARRMRETCREIAF